MSEIPSLDLPEDWVCLKTEDPGPFVTRAILRHPLGVRVHWNSREHRKHHISWIQEKLYMVGARVNWMVDGIIFSIGPR